MGRRARPYLAMAPLHRPPQDGKDDVALRLLDFMKPQVGSTPYPFSGP